MSAVLDLLWGPTKVDDGSEQVDIVQENKDLKQKVKDLEQQNARIKDQLKTLYKCFSEIEDAMGKIIL